MPLRGAQLFIGFGIRCGMWVDTIAVQLNNPPWRDMVSSCIHEWWRYHHDSSERNLSRYGLRKTYPQKPPPSPHDRPGRAMSQPRLLASAPEAIGAPGPSGEVAEPVQGIDPRFIVWIQQRPFVRHA